jgi:two-component system C4-dicarboxylate transport sensor histidine kinase DctB
LTEQVRGDHRPIAQFLAAARGRPRHAAQRSGRGALLILRPRLGSIACDIALGEDPLVMASRLRLEQVLVNLLHNAIDALSTGPTRASSLSPRRKSRVRLRIRDNGPGISPEIAGRLFTPFATSRTMG